MQSVSFLYTHLLFAVYPFLFLRFVNSFVKNPRVIVDVLFFRSARLLTLRNYVDKLILTGSSLSSAPFFLPSKAYGIFFPF